MVEWLNLQDHVRCRKVVGIDHLHLGPIIRWWILIEDGKERRQPGVILRDRNVERTT